MAGGPFSPNSSAIVTAGLFPNTHVFGGSNFSRLEGFAFPASVAADSTYEFAWKLPSTLPTGTLKLDLSLAANATSGAAKLNPKWNMVDYEVDITGVTLSAEGVQTVTWAAGDNVQVKHLQVNLDAVTPLASQWLIMQLVGETSGWTLAQILTVVPLLVFE